MKTRTLGRSGYKVSDIGLGCWQLGNDFGPIDDTQAGLILDSARDAGVTFFDTADVYGNGLSETRIGYWLRDQSSKPLVVTKVGRASNLYPDQYTRAKVLANIEGSIRRLGVEALDLVQLHCVPTPVLMDGDLLSWLEDFQQQGLIHQFGASVEMIDEALFCCDHPKLTSIQIIFNLLRQDAIEELLPKAEKNNIGIIVRLPLASGLLSGKMNAQRNFSPGDHRNYNRDGQMFHVGETFNGIPFETGLELVEELKALLPENMNLLQMALRWILDHPQVSTVIAGATRPEQVNANAAISELPRLSIEQHQQLKAFYYNQVRQHIRGGI
jgi:aryl-alcohol dehydrogenase-like predicted oxidoreductase